MTVTDPAELMLRDKRWLFHSASGTPPLNNVQSAPPPPRALFRRAKRTVHRTPLATLCEALDVIQNENIPFGLAYGSGALEIQHKFRFVWMSRTFRKMFVQHADTF